MKIVNRLVQSVLMLGILIAPPLFIKGDGDTFAATPTQQKIVYTQVRGTENSGDSDFGADLIVMNKDGSNKVNITNSADKFEAFAEWSPNGSQIAYISSNQSGGDAGLMVVNSDGTNKRSEQDAVGSEEINTGFGFFEWMKDGKNLFVFGGQSPSLYVASSFNTEAMVHTVLGEIPIESGHVIDADYNAEKNYIFLNIANEPSISDQSTCSLYIIKLDEGLEKNLVSENDGHCVQTFSSPSGNKVMQSIADLADGQPAGNPGSYTYSIVINNSETYEQDFYEDVGSLFEVHPKSPWSQSEEFILIGDTEFGVPFNGMRLLNVSDGSIREDVSIAGTRNIPWGQIIDGDSNILFDMTNAGVSGGDPNFSYIGVYNIETGQIVNLTGGDEYYEVYSDIYPNSSTDEPELPFVDPSTIAPPRTGVSVSVLSVLVATLSVLSLIGYGSAKTISKRSFSGSER